MYRDQAWTCSNEMEGLMQVMTDPDAPSPSEPTMREWVQWLVMATKNTHLINLNLLTKIITLLIFV